MRMVIRMMTLRRFLGIYHDPLVSHICWEISVMLVTN